MFAIQRHDRRLLIAIALISAHLLFVEMLLVRWIGTEIRVFAYLQNAVLVAAFLGLGWGARCAQQPLRVASAGISLFGLALIIRDPMGWHVAEALSQGLTAFEDSVIWMTNVAPRGEMVEKGVWIAMVTFGLLLSLSILWATALVMRPLGQVLGAYLNAATRPIAAYTANVLGSILGIALFDLLTIGWTAPAFWLWIAAAGFVPIILKAQDARPARLCAVLLLIATPWLVMNPHDQREAWSPYQKLSLQPFMVFDRNTQRAERCGDMIQVNNIGYQALVDLNAEHMAANPGLYPPDEINASHYIYPHKLVGQRDRVLVVGAGAGNDVAGALRAGAQRIDAVEIDPVIEAWGRELHPNRPYTDPRVNVIITDARAFVRGASGPYDLIWFGLLDSHTTPSAYTNVRLDHFVYTREAFADMRRLLKPDGVMVVFFQVEAEWIADRLARLLNETFGTPPIAAVVRTSSRCLGWGGLLFVAGPPSAMRSIQVRLDAQPELARPILAKNLFPLKTVVPTDDWPYLYLRTPAIPRYHLLVAGACLLIGIALRRRLFQAGEEMNPAMLLLGAGFMLVEVSGVSRAALLFGTTWTVNAYVVGAILIMVLLANYWASRVQYDPAGWPFAALCAALLALGFIPLRWLAISNLSLRILMGGLILSLPVLFSGLIFVALWVRSKRKDLAIGSNLLGSLLGGVLSMLSMVIGFQALIFLTLAIYLCVWLLMRRSAV